MRLSDLSIRRPVFAAVLSLLLITFGLVAFDRLPLREYPDIDPPIVSIDTVYPGAAANIVETRITQLIEDRIAGLEGIKTISSSSVDGRSRIDVEFAIDRPIDNAANDIRDRVAGVLDQLPIEAEPPDIQKADSNDDVIMWLNLASDRLDVPQLTDYARRFLVDQFSVLDGVARVRVGGNQTYAMRIWLDRHALAARQLTVLDVEAALRAENIELPAGGLESETRYFSIRTERQFKTVHDFEQLVLYQTAQGDLVRLSDVARVELGTEEDRILFRGNGVAMVGLGIVKQSTANTIEVAELAQAAMERLNKTLPDGIRIHQSYDGSVFVRAAMIEVYKTLIIAIVLVIAVIFLFLGSVRTTLIPAVTVPVSLIATFIVLLVLDFSINILTLFALVLAIGLVVDDAIVVLENIHRRMDHYGETRLVAAYYGTRQVEFAVIATTVVLVSVFVPITFLQGDIGRLFTEFAVTMAIAVSFSTVIALSLSPMLASKWLLAHPQQDIKTQRRFHVMITKLQQAYRAVLQWLLQHAWMIVLLFVLFAVVSVWLLTHIPREYTPKEDRGAFYLMVNGPEGASFAYMQEYMDEIERRLLPYLDSGEVMRLLVRAPRHFGGGESFNSGIVILVMSPFHERPPTWIVMDDIRQTLSDLPGVRVFPVMRQGFGQRTQKPVQFVLGGGTYDELATWRDQINSALAEHNPGLIGVDWDYKETKPRLRVSIDYDRAASLGVSIRDIGHILETMFGSRRVTTYYDAGEEYDVIVQGERAVQRTPSSLDGLYVRSSRTQELIPLANLVTIEETAEANSLNRYNRVRAITLEANLADTLSLDQALQYLEQLVVTQLPEQATVDYKGTSQDFRSSNRQLLLVFLLGGVVVYLVLAAQFESWIHPLTIMLTVPLAITGALCGLWVNDLTLNLYSQIGLIMLVGLAAKNGILIVEFANQLRDQGFTIRDAIMDASLTRLRPIMMTGITTAAGAIPLLLSTGAGAETRAVIGIVVLWGVIAAALFTLFVVPVAYSRLAVYTGSVNDVSRRLDNEAKGVDQSSL
jgi:multidrug efflux pump